MSLLGSWRFFCGFGYGKSNDSSTFPAQKPAPSMAAWPDPRNLAYGMVWEQRPCLCRSPLPDMRANENPAPTACKNRDDADDLCAVMLGGFSSSRWQLFALWEHWIAAAVGRKPDDSDFVAAIAGMTAVHPATPAGESTMQATVSLD